MDYQNKYDYFYNKTFNYCEKHLKKRLINSYKEGETFNYAHNMLIKDLDNFIKLKFDYLKSKEFIEVFDLFNKRNTIYNKNAINSIFIKKIEPIIKYKNLVYIQSDKIICEFAQYNALKEVSRISSNNTHLYEMIYNINLFSKYKLKSYRSRIYSEPLYEELRLKLYPEKKKNEKNISIEKTMDNEFLNVKQVAELTGYAVATIYDKKHKGKIPFHKTGAKLLFKKSDILLWIEKGKGVSKYDLDKKASDYISKNKIF